MNKTAKLYSTISLIILSGIYLSALFFGKFSLDTVAPLVSFIAFLLLFLCAKNWKDLIFCATVYALLFAATQSVAISTAWICIFATIVLGAYIITVGDKIQILMILMTCPLAYLVSMVLAGSAVIALAVLLPYPAMLCLGICSRKCINRKNTIIYSTMGLVASTALGIFILCVKNAVKATEIKSSIEWIKGFVVQYMAEFKVYTAEGQTNLFVDAEYIKEYLDMLANILPGTLIFLFVVISFAAQLLLFSTLKKERLIEYMTSDVTEIQISGACAGVYLTALVISFTTNSEGNIMLGSAVMQNIYLALTPALAFVCVDGINKLCRKIKIRPTFLLAIPAAYLLYQGLLSVSLAILGAIIIIISKAKRYANSPSGKENGK